MDSAVDVVLADDWVCEKCTYINDGAHATCEMCDSAPPSVPLALPATKPRKKAAPTKFGPLSASDLLFTYNSDTFELPEVSGLTNFGYLKDMIENQTGIAYQDIVLLQEDGKEITAEMGMHLDQLFNARDRSKQMRITVLSKGKPKKAADSSDMPVDDPSFNRGFSGVASDVDMAGWDEQPAEDGGWGAGAGASAEWTESAQVDDIPDVDIEQADTDALDEEKEAGSVVENGNFKITSHQDLEAMMMNALQETADLLGVSVDEAGVISRAYSWQRQALMNDVEQGIDKVLEKLGQPDKKDKVIAVPASDPTTPFSCPLCGDDTTIGKSTALRCGHRFCDECWTNWINAEFDKGTVCLFSNCPAFKCKVVLPTSAFMKYLDAPRRKKISAFLLDNYVSNNKSTAWCPGKDCSVAATADTPNTAVQCTCGHAWCFKCRQDDHRPTSCEDAERWTQKNNSDSENVTWIMANTKNCPKCKVNIEKNQGCNHMTCRSCKHEFCWLCKADWRNHSSCAQFSADIQKAEKAAADARNDLQRYMHYFERFANHLKAIKHAVKTRADTNTRMLNLQNMKGSGSKDVQYLLDAVNTVIQCHHTLQWTYVYGFYLDHRNKTRLLFENNQTSLESFTDHLHELTEQPLDNLMDGHARTQIISYTRLVQKFRKNVIKAIQAGYKV